MPNPSDSLAGTTRPAVLGDDAAMALVDRYLRLCQDRQLADASAMLMDDPVLIFPGGVRHVDLDALVADAATRYRWVRKTRLHTAAGRDDQGRQVVSHQGVLSGRNLHDLPFEDVRYLDLFILHGDRIAEQHVFNDLAATGVLTATDDRSRSTPPQGR